LCSRRRSAGSASARTTTAAAPARRTAEKGCTRQTAAREPKKAFCEAWGVNGDRGREEMGF